MKQKHIQHLYWRAGFGITPDQLNALSQKNRRQIVDMLFSESSTMTDLIIDTPELDRYSLKDILKNKTKRRDFIEASIEKLKIFNTLWVDRLMSSQEMLREKMTLFWANHFVCRDENIFHVQQYNNILREHALGNFGDFVKAISKEAAMLKFLNGKQNLKEQPNENFARELIELFTMGEGHYTEEDIKQSARAFTGYDNNFEGEFILRHRRHDYGFKTFLGHTGRYDGDDIIDIILEQKQCARFICGKIYKYFVNETIDKNRVEELTTVFYENYDIEQLMRYIFMSDWFYAEEHIGMKIKSPIELLAGMVKTVPTRFNEAHDILKIQKLLGQTLLHPPNVAGWKGGKSWIDSNTIMLRLKLPSAVLANAKISIAEKGDFEDAFNMYNSRRRKNKFVDVTVDWNMFDKRYKEVSIVGLKKHLIMPELNNGTQKYLDALSKSSKRDFCVQLMSLPEYQMC